MEGMTRCPASETMPLTLCVGWIWGRLRCDMAGQKEEEEGASAGGEGVEAGMQDAAAQFWAS